MQLSRVQRDDSKIQFSDSDGCDLASRFDARFRCSPFLCDYHRQRAISSTPVHHWNTTELCTVLSNSFLLTAIGRNKISSCRINNNILYVCRSFLLFQCICHFSDLYKVCLIIRRILSLEKSISSFTELMFVVEKGVTSIFLPRFSNAVVIERL